MENSPNPSVLYTASSPVCDFETWLFARYAEDNMVPIRSDDLNSDALGQ